MGNLKFTNNDGVEYLYDNDYGIIYENIGDNNKEYINNFKNSLKTIFGKKYKNEINSNNLIDYYEENGFTELIFKMTDACNMRCKYCIYSEYYPNTLSYGKDYIKVETVKKAIDYYISQVKKQANIVAKKKPFIAFYGGEPLMAFDVIKEAIEYTNDKYKDIDIHFTITTNGLLLNDKEVVEFLKKNNVIICLSLDGYKENHDRNRVGINNKASYDVLLNIIEKHFSDYHNIYTLCCIDKRTDLIKLYDHYKKNDRLEYGKIPHVLRLSYIFNQDSNYYEQFSKDEINKFALQYKQLRDKYIELSINNQQDWFLDLLIGQEFLRIIDRIKFNSAISFYGKSGCCVPGDKIFVYQDGRYGICEKVCIDGIDIGNVDNGLDIEKIKNYMKFFDEATQKKCKECPISQLCSLCYVNLNKEGELALDNEFCENQKRYIIDMFKDIIYIEEKNPGFWERKINKYAKNNLKNNSIENVLSGIINL